MINSSCFYTNEGKFTAHLHVIGIILIFFYSLKNGMTKKPIKFNIFSVIVNFLKHENYFQGKHLVPDEQYRGSYNELSNCTGFSFLGWFWRTPAIPATKWAMGHDWDSFMGYRLWWQGEAGNLYPRGQVPAMDYQEYHRQINKKSFCNIVYIWTL